MNRRCLVLLAASLALAASAHAGTVAVSQKGKRFEPAAVTISVGDTVHFANDDDVTHNVRTLGPDGAMRSSGTQHPGEGIDFVYDKPGAYEVFCGIHPTMYMTVTVK